MIGEVLEHIREPERLLDEARRVLRPGGTLVGSTPNGFRLKNRLAFSPGGIRSPTRRTCTSSRPTTCARCSPTSTTGRCSSSPAGSRVAPAAARERDRSSARRSAAELVEVLAPGAGARGGAGRAQRERASRRADRCRGSRRGRSRGGARAREHADRVRRGKESRLGAGDDAAAAVGKRERRRGQVDEARLRDRLADRPSSVYQPPPGK